MLIDVVHTHTHADTHTHAHYIPHHHMCHGQNMDWRKATREADARRLGGGAFMTEPLDVCLMFVTPVGITHINKSWNNIQLMWEI